MMAKGKDLRPFMEVSAERFLVIGHSDVRVDSAAEYVAVHGDQIHRPRMFAISQCCRKRGVAHGVDVIAGD